MSRDIDILVQACLKSVIESGVQQDKWKESTQEAIKVFYSIRNAIVDHQEKKATNDRR
jgi:hypothetical protein